MSKTFTKKDIPDITDKFNKNIKKIMKILESNIVNNITYDTLRRRVVILMKETPLILLQEGGKVFYEKKDYIINNKLDELFDRSLSTYINDTDINDGDINFKGIDSLFSIIKDIWMKFNEEEKKYVHKIFKSLLSEYSKYKMIN
jgi:hypothetical protein